MLLNQLRYLMMNAEMAEEKEWMDMESRIRRHIGNDSFRILLTSKANGERFSKCSGILLEGVEGGVLYLLPEPEAERIMKEKDERFCLGVGKEHRSVMEIPEAYQEALLAREMAFIQKNPVEEYQKKCFEEKPELAQFQEKFILQVPTDRADTVLRKMRNWYFEAAHQRVSPYQLLTVTEAICKELDLFTACRKNRKNVRVLCSTVMQICFWMRLKNGYTFTGKPEKSDSRKRKNGRGNFIYSGKLCKRSEYGNGI